MVAIVCVLVGLSLLIMPFGFTVRADVDILSLSGEIDVTLFGVVTLFKRWFRIEREGEAQAKSSVNQPKAGKSSVEREGGARAKSSVSQSKAERFSTECEGAEQAKRSANQPKAGVSSIGREGAEQAKRSVNQPKEGKSTTEREGGARVYLVVGHGEKRVRYSLAGGDSEKSVKKLAESGFVPYIDVLELDVALTVGKRDDAFFSAMLLSSLRVIICAGLAALKTSQKVTIRDRFACAYGEDVVKLGVFGIIEVSIADIIYSFMLHLMRKARHRKTA